MKRREFCAVPAVAAVVGVDLAEAGTETGAVIAPQKYQCGHCHDVMYSVFADDGTTVTECVNRECPQYEVRLEIPIIRLPVYKG